MESRPSAGKYNEGSGKLRLTKLRQLLIDNELEAIVIGQPENRRYLSGFSGSSGYLIISQEEQVLATDGRYYEQVGRECPGWRLEKVKQKFTDILPGLLTTLGAKRVGFESTHLSVATYEKWREAAGKVEWVATANLVESLRQAKDEDELAAIRRAVAIADQALAELRAWLRPGLTEREIAWELESAVRRHGAEKTSFDIIVASGPNSALPHHKTGERPIAADEPILIDMGCIFAGYCSDVTRTLCLGQSNGRFNEIYELVLRAQERAETGIKAGMAAREADALARRVIAEAGYGEFFDHGLGHGVGLAIHEDPRMTHISEDTLPAGTVVTVEPGVYLPAWGGVRIEDMVVVRQDGVEILTASSKERYV
jgi:Xaa-Pro aminopeptidase